MNPGTILAWTGALALSAVILALAAAAVINIIRSIRTAGTRPQAESTHPIYRGADHDA